jgi:hypothetical protein
MRVVDAVSLSPFDLHEAWARLFWMEPCPGGRMPGGGNYVVVATMQSGVRRCGNDVVGRSPDGGAGGDREAGGAAGSGGDLMLTPREPHP